MEAGGEKGGEGRAPKVGSRHCLGGNALGDRRQCGDSAWAYLAGQTQPLQRRIDFERQWLVSPVQEMWVRANAEVGMFRSFVVGPGCLRIAVVGHGKSERSSWFKNSLVSSAAVAAAERRRTPRILAWPTNTPNEVGRTDPLDVHECYLQSTTGRF